MVYCFFEQSGTFKTAFKDFGIYAEDFDIRNDYGQTDHIIDIFAEIQNCTNGGGSIFDTIKASDLVFAFFPCTYFETQGIMACKGTKHGMEKWTQCQKLEYSKRRFNKMAEYFGIITDLAIIAYKKGLSLIIENPYSADHCLTRYWPEDPEWIDLDRTMRGDAFKKPTQYYAINYKFKNNFVLDPLYYAPARKNIVDASKGKARSEITREYAERFIKEFIL